MKKIYLGDSVYASWDNFGRLIIYKRATRRMKDKDMPVLLFRVLMAIGWLERKIRKALQR